MIIELLLSWLLLIFTSYILFRLLIVIQWSYCWMKWDGSSIGFAPVDGQKGVLEVLLLDSVAFCSLLFSDVRWHEQSDSLRQGSVPPPVDQPNQSFVWRWPVEEPWYVRAAEASHPDLHNARRKRNEKNVKLSSICPETSNEQSWPRQINQVLTFWRLAGRISQRNRLTTGWWKDPLGPKDPTSWPRDELTDLDWKFPTNEIYKRAPQTDLNKLHDLAFDDFSRNMLILTSISAAPSRPRPPERWSSGRVFATTGKWEEARARFQGGCKTRPAPEINKNAMKYNSSVYYLFYFIFLDEDSLPKIGHQESAEVTRSGSSGRTHVAEPAVMWVNQAGTWVCCRTHSTLLAWGSPSST